MKKQFGEGTRNKFVAYGCDVYLLLNSVILFSLKKPKPARLSSALPLKGTMDSDIDILITQGVLHYKLNDYFSLLKRRG